MESVFIKLRSLGSARKRTLLEMSGHGRDCGRLCDSFVAHCFRAEYRRETGLGPLSRRVFGLLRCSWLLRRLGLSGAALRRILGRRYVDLILRQCSF